MEILIDDDFLFTTVFEYFYAREFVMSCPGLWDGLTP